MRASRVVRVSRHLDAAEVATLVDSGELLAGGFDAVFDGIGEDGVSRAWRAVGPRGHLSAFGFSAGVTANVWQAQLGLWLAKLWWWNAFSAPRMASFFSITSTRKAHPEWFVADLGKLIDLLDRGVIAPDVGERIGLDSVARFCLVRRTELQLAGAGSRYCAGLARNRSSQPGQQK